jgi:hypothetical protein
MGTKAKGTRRMTNQEILDNAPDGATHFIQQTLSVVYFKYNKQIPLHWCNDKKGWRGSLYFEFNNFRLLADISKITELEKERAVRDLEQQARGLEDYVSDNSFILHLDPEDIHHCILINLNATALRLLARAKALKEQE